MRLGTWYCVTAGFIVPGAADTPALFGFVRKILVLFSADAANIRPINGRLGSTDLPGGGHRGKSRTFCWATAISGDWRNGDTPLLSNDPQESIKPGWEIRGYGVGNTPVPGLLARSVYLGTEFAARAGCYVHRWNLVKLLYKMTQSDSNRLIRSSPCGVCMHMHIRFGLQWLVSATLAAGLVLATPAMARAGFEDGAAAYQQGDFSKALHEWTPLAEQGHGDVQYLLGRMYHVGLGVPQDYAEAALWYRRAAEQGNPGCQFLLGFLYSTGRGVPKDLVQAHFWFSVSAARGSDASRKSRERVAKKMTPAQIAEAQRLAREWMEKRRGK